MLGDFLRTRRARLRPADVGLRDYGEFRRVPGLRREELARLAGVSPGYYTRLEQDQGGNVSDSVLEALARALRLDDEERTHLHTLANAKITANAPERLAPRHRMLLETLDSVPALILGRHVDVLAWNRRGHALLAPHLEFDARPNWARLFFLDREVRALFGESADKARDTVADLRQIAGRRPGDAVLAALIEDLRESSAEFDRLWSAHPVRACAHHTRTYHHPHAGRLTLTDELLPLPDEGGQRLVVFYAEPGSASAAALAGVGATPARAEFRGERVAVVESFSPKIER
ncbi:helix-turn-helix transcriptional regulator [Amycolatopsis magusensis]|uniref:Transcriptional regulator with XRE-family HTH domain n=1 Tax=Amycolatopsis magusensis TaxID=882444 RepID=A0ABS4PQ51_9PSEU|nr:helix-turn-helix transcriptional regulator [Amycolatopsis magusensis]MBP2181540.1 transcriptional regulator with XRE-family HTH domain [Amycolatopsis magusensis]